jgi:hypothetical protein
MPNIVTGFYAPRELVDRVDGLTKKLQHVDYLAVTSKVCCSFIGRTALLEGVKAAEKRRGLRVCGLEAAPWKRKDSKDIKRAKEKIPHPTLITFGVPLWLLDRVDRVAETMNDDPGVSVSVSRSSVMRAAISEGLEILNERYKTELSNEQT